MEVSYSPRLREFLDRLGTASAQLETYRGVAQLDSRDEAELARIAFSLRDLIAMVPMLVNE
jgi:hypothetical protein